jgi:hypothetical protein
VVTVAVRRDRGRAEGDAAVGADHRALVEAARIARSEGEEAEQT